MMCCAYPYTAKDLYKSYRRRLTNDIKSKFIIAWTPMSTQKYISKVEPDAMVKIQPAH